MLTTATKRKIDTARDILVGKIPVPTSQVEQITLALVYKFMSDMDKKAKDLGDSSGFFANGYEKYAWGKLMDKALPARDRVLLYREALEKMSLNPHIPQLFRDVFRDASLPFNDPETLKLFLDVIDQFEYDHSEELGNAFEYLLQVMGSQGDAGQFRTPRHIIDFIVDVVEPSKTDKILDPACGTAGFLISAYNHIKKNGLSSEEMTQLSENFVGYDISQDMQRLSLVNLYLHHFPNPHIYEYDTLTSEDRWNDDFDVILANPPFMTPKGGIRPHNRFSVPSKRAEVLFVDYIMEHLTARGKAGVIVPEGIIFQSQNSYKQLRKMMVEENYLWAVVSLPSGIFNPYSGVKTSILLFDREIAQKTNKILFVKVSSDGFDLGAQRHNIDKNDLPNVLKTLERWKKAIISDDQASFNLPTLSGLLVPVSKLAKNGEYNLGADRYIDIIQNKQQTHTTVEIGKIADVIRGITFSKQDQLDYKTPDSIRVITTKAAQEEGIIEKDLYFIKKSKANNDEKLVQEGDILISTANSLNLVGRTTYVPKLDYEASFGAFMTLIRANHEIVNPIYLLYCLRSEQARSYFLSIANTTTNISNITFSDLKSFQIPLPSQEFQKQVVGEIVRFEKIIAGAKQIIKNYTPSFEIKADWERIEVGKVAKILSGGTPSKSNKAYWQGDIPWVSPKDMKFLEISDSQDHISKTAIDESATRLVEPGTVLCVVRSGILKHSLPVGITTKAVAFNQDISAIQADRKKLNPKYLFYFLIQNEQKILAEGIKPGVTVQSFYSGFLKNFKVPLPSLEEQNKIVEILDGEAEHIKSVRNLIASTEDRIKNKIGSIWNE